MLKEPKLAVDRLLIGAFRMMTILACVALPLHSAVAQDATQAPAADQGFTTTVEPAIAPAKPKKKPAAKPAAAKPADGAAASDGKSAKAAAGGSDTAIVVVVNDEPISNYKVDQRMALNGLGGGEGATEKLKAKLKSPGIQD
jgi:hypothetical protein